MPGLFVARGAEIVWSYRARHQADHPEFAQPRGFQSLIIVSFPNQTADDHPLAIVEENSRIDRRKLFRWKPLEIH